MIHRDGFIDGVVVPFLQSTITGIFTGVCVGAIASLLRLPAALQVGFAVGSAAALAGWLAYRAHWQWTIEKIIGFDVNGDGAIGEPPLPPARAEPVRIEIVSDGGRAVEFIDLPYPEKIPLLAAGLLQGKTLAQSVWTGQGALFSRNEFETIRAELLRRGLARWRKDGAPGQGVDLTPAGRAVFKRLAELPPTLPEGMGRE